jgi:hypothetical protein
MVRAAERTHDSRALGSSAPAATAFAFGGSSDLVKLHQNVIHKRKYKRTDEA